MFRKGLGEAFQVWLRGPVLGVGATVLRGDVATGTMVLFLLPAGFNYSLLSTFLKKVFPFNCGLINIVVLSFQGVVQFGIVGCGGLGFRFVLWGTFGGGTYLLASTCVFSQLNGPYRVQYCFGGGTMVLGASSGAYCYLPYHGFANIFLPDTRGLFIKGNCFSIVNGTFGGHLCFIACLGTIFQIDGT